MIVGSSAHLPLRIEEAFDTDAEIHADPRVRILVRVDVVSARRPVERNDLSRICLDGVVVAALEFRFAPQIDTRQISVSERDPKVLIGYTEE